MGKTASDPKGDKVLQHACKARGGVDAVPSATTSNAAGVL
jgi:hypothetical protein